MTLDCRCRETLSQGLFLCPCLKDDMTAFSLSLLQNAKGEQRIGKVHFLWEALKEKTAGAGQGEAPHLGRPESGYPEARQQ